MVDTVCFEGELCYPRPDTNGCRWHFLLLFPCRGSEYFCHETSISYVTMTLVTKLAFQNVTNKIVA